MNELRDRPARGLRVVDQVMLKFSSAACRRRAALAVVDALLRVGAAEGRLRTDARDGY